MSQTYKLKIISASLGLILIATCISFTNVYANSDQSGGRIPQKVNALKAQGLFKDELKPFVIAENAAYMESLSAVKKYDLLNLTNDVAQIIQAKPEYLKITLRLGEEWKTILLFKETISQNGFELMCERHRISSVFASFCTNDFGLHN
jgi:hypothetical protein